MKLKIAFFGTPYFAAHLLERVVTELKDTVEVELVVTQSDSKVGRKQILTPTPVKKIAQKHGLPLFDNDISHLPTRHDLERNMSEKSLDLVLLFAYGKIIPASMLKIPVRGFWNIHPSLLPKYRGASPLAYPFLLSELHTGVTLMQMDSEMDHGDILKQSPYDIVPEDTRVELETKLTNIGFELFKSQLLQPAQPQKQDHSLATFTRLLKKTDGFVTFDFVKKALADQSIVFPELPEIFQDYFSRNNISKPDFEFRASDVFLRLYRALNTWPGVWTMVSVSGEQKRLKITKVDLMSDKLKIISVQLEGKNEVGFEQFNSAYKIY